MTDKKDLATRVIFAGQSPDPQTGALMTPIFPNATFRQTAPAEHQGMAYGRGCNPTRHAFERCVADLEGGVRGFAFTSGMAAIDAVLHTLASGDHVLAIDDLYGGTRRLFENVYRPQHNINFTYHDFATNPSVEGLITPQTKMLWLETPTNPLLKIVDLQAIIASAKKHGLVVVVDNTLCSPIIQRPFEFGADIVVHSVTKYINGHSDVVGGLVICKEQGALTDRIAYLYNAVGGVMGPFDAFLAMRGVKTLDVRLQRQMENALKIVKYLDGHPKIKQVLYPGLASHPQHAIAKKQMNGFGAMISIVLKADYTGVKTFLSSLQVFTLAESLGGVESLVNHPARMTHASIPADVREALGVTDDLVRLSVGIESAKDLLADLEQALAKI